MEIHAAGAADDGRARTLVHAALVDEANQRGVLGVDGLIGSADLQRGPRLVVDGDLQGDTGAVRIGERGELDAEVRDLGHRPDQSGDLLRAGHCQRQRGGGFGLGRLNHRAIRNFHNFADRGNLQCKPERERLPYSQIKVLLNDLGKAGF